MMDLDLWEMEPQIILLAVSLIIGFVTGILFDIYRYIRNLLSPGPFFTALGDLCFWGLITFITFTALLIVSFGEVRGYVFLCIAIGLMLYLYFISRYVTIFFIMLGIFITRFLKKISFVVNQIKKVMPCRLVSRIWNDAKRIFIKIKK